METLLSLSLGVGLAAACGFRVFVPLLGISLAGMSGHVELAEGMQWMATWPAAICFFTATLLEIGGYYVPWIDNLLDTIATPAAIIAGTIAAASMIQEMSPMMRWVLALIAGGGIAGLIQSATVALRGTSSATTAGTANPLVATGELLLAVLTTLLSLLAPLIAVVVLTIVAVAAMWLVVSRRGRVSATPRRETSS
jgi:hypothetical protein